MNRLPFFVCVIAAAGAAQACDICATHLALGAWGQDARLNVSLFSQYSKFDQGHELESFNHQIAGAWRFNDRWAVQAGVPYLDRDLDGETTSGIGDATLLGIFRLHHDVKGTDATVVDIYAGLKFPTGDTDELKEERDVALEAKEHEEHGHEEADGDGHHAEHAHGHVVSPGSGSLDGIFGARAIAKRGRWQASAAAQYLLRTEGDYDYQYGNELILNAGARYYVVLRANSYIALGADITRDKRERDEVLGEKQESTPASSYIGPAIEAAFGENFSLFAAWDIAIEGEDEGLHGAADKRARAGVNFAF